MSKVFSGDNIHEVNQAILDYVEWLKEKSLEGEPGIKLVNTPVANKKATAAVKRKAKADAKAKAKAKATPEPDDDLDDLLPDEDGDDFGVEDDPPLENDEGDDFGDDDLLPEEDGEPGPATKEDVRDILGQLSRTGSGYEETAQKVLKKIGGVEEFNKLKADKFQKVYDAAVRLIDKIEKP